MKTHYFAGFSLASVLALSLLTGCSSEPIARVFRVVGHRGSPYSAVENTLPAFDAAAREGANAIETDLCVTQDNRIVIWHDCDPNTPTALLRQQGGEGLPYVPFVPPQGSPERRPVHELTLGELRKYYGYAPINSDEREPDARIPELGELFVWLADHPEIDSLYLDIKLADNQTEQADFLVKQVIEEHKKGSQTRVYFLSVHDKIATAMEAARIREGATSLRVIRDYETEGALEGTKRLGLRDVTTGYTAWRSWGDYVEEVEDLVSAREDGEIDSVVTWTIDDDKDQEELIRLGVDGILSNKPGLVAVLYATILAQEREEREDAAD
jgi:glycerophosphoryl diester phosphodiesterase